LGGVCESLWFWLARHVATIAHKTGSVLTARIVISLARRRYLAMAGNGVSEIVLYQRIKTYERSHGLARHSNERWLKNCLAPDYRSER
jgi:hypothetical protein